MKIKQRVYHFIEPSYEPGRIVDITIITLIIWPIHVSVDTSSVVNPINKVCIAFFNIFSSL